MGKKVKTQGNIITQYLWPAAAAGSETCEVVLPLKSTGFKQASKESLDSTL